MAKSGPCNFCKRAAPRVGGAEDGLPSDLFMCGGCRSTLRDPVHGPQFLRNHLAMENRGLEPASSLRFRIDKFIEAAEEARLKKAMS